MEVESCREGILRRQSVVEVDRTPKSCLHTRVNHRHGTYLAYDKDACRCYDCCAAKMRHRYRVIGQACGLVSADRSREHVTLLLSVLTVGQIEARSGVNRTTIRRLIGSHRGAPRSERVERTTEAALFAVRPVRFGPEKIGFVDGTGTRRRLRALMALGWGGVWINAQLKTSSATAWRITVKDRPVTVQMRDAVVHIYDRFSMSVPPPSYGTMVAKRTARTHGWPPPLAWDDESIDDPSARPVEVGCDQVVDEVAIRRMLDGDLHGRLSRDERQFAVKILALRGENDRAIVARLHVAEETVRRDRRALGVESTWKRSGT